MIIGEITMFQPSINKKFGCLKIPSFELCFNLKLNLKLKKLK